MTPTVLHVTGKDIDKNITSLINSGPNFVLTPKFIPYMEIITAIESQALNLESGKKDTSSENLRQTLDKILSKTIGRKQDNLSEIQRTALKQLKNYKQIKVYPFHKGIRFPLLNGMDAISKMEEQLGKSKSSDYEPTNLLTEKFQRLLRKLEKEDKFGKIAYSLIYPSNCVPPKLHRTSKTRLRKTTP